VTSLARALGARDDALMSGAEAAMVASVTDGGGRPGAVTHTEAATARDLMRVRYGRPGWHQSGT
jgi:hypothetical protein